MADTLDRLTAALADRYAIQEELGAGGMATVYLAEDLKHAGGPAPGGVKTLGPVTTGCDRCHKRATASRDTLWRNDLQPR